MATTGQKRSHPDENESSDIDEEALLAIDEDDDVSKELNLDNLQLSDDDDDDITETGATCQTERGLNLREYQKELAENAIRGENTIVYAATGAGKTRVAFYVIQKHLELNPSGKIAIMAEKTFLVHQHFLALKKILPELQDKTLCLSGQNEKGGQLHLLIDEFTVIILTPALIENTVKRHDPNFMSKFTLLVFDECHHTQKKSNYNRLMTRYHVMKSENKSPLPQIVGLTATLGTNKANNVEKAKEHALKVMANLDVVKISSVTKNTGEYERCRKDVKSDKMVLPEQGEYDIVHQCIEKYMCKTEELLSISTDNDASSDPCSDDDIKTLAMVIKKRTSLTRNDPQYITWTSELSTIAARLLGREPEIARRVTIGASYLKIYSEVLGVNDELTGIFATKAMNRKLQHQHLGSYSKSEDQTEIEFSKLGSDLMSDMTEICKEIKHLNGKPVFKLLQLLKNYCEESREEARFIVFVNTRETCEMLTELIKSEGLKCATFTGSSAASDVGGTSRSEQENVVKQFNEGNVNGLIATNILEEGFDIPNCDYVIHYNYVGNEISTRQTAGRIRKQEGKRVVLSKKKDLLRESLNIQRGFLMDEAMTCILSMSENDIRKCVQAEQNRIIVHEQMKNKSVAKVPKLDSSPFKMVCKKCGKFEIDCSNLRSIDGHHVIIDADIWTNVSMKPFPKTPPSFDGITCQGRLFGAGGSSCPHELGVVSMYRGVKLPFVSHKFFLVKNTTTLKTSLLTKWADVPFHIPNIKDPEDLVIMQI